MILHCACCIVLHYSPCLLIYIALSAPSRAEVARSLLFIIIVDVLHLHSEFRFTMYITFKQVQQQLRLGLFLLLHCALTAHSSYAIIAITYLKFHELTRDRNAPSPQSLHAAGLSPRGKVGHSVPERYAWRGFDIRVTLSLGVSCSCSTGYTFRDINSCNDNHDNNNNTTHRREPTTRPPKTRLPPHPHQHLHPHHTHHQHHQKRQTRLPQRPRP